jgi:pimeloyl-ACP methyl ester carboxylesterase
MRKEVRTATSADGTPIVFDRLGDGPPVIVVGGQFCDRVLTHPTAEELAKHFTVFNYDRRGRGDSGDTQPYAIEREIEDIGALIAEAGGTASVYAHSSGASLALHAAAAGLPIARLVLHEPPYAPDSRGGTVPTDSTWAGRSQTPCLTGGTRSWRARNNVVPLEVLVPVLEEFFAG